MKIKKLNYRERYKVNYKNQILKYFGGESN